MGYENFFNELGNVDSGQTSKNGWTIIKTEPFKGLLQDDVNIYHIRVCSEEKKNKYVNEVKGSKDLWQWDDSVKKTYFDKTAYYHRDNSQSKQAICLHWTGGCNAGGAINTMAKKDHAAVSYVIDRDGKIYSMFEDCYYASHLGPMDKVFNGVNVNKNMSKRSIAIEIVGMGQLTENGSNYKDAYGSAYKGKVLKLGYTFRKKKNISWIPDVQRMAIYNLLLHLMAKYNIPNVWQCDKANLSDSYSGMFKNASGDLDANVALNFCGVYSHSCARKDKLDWPDEVMKEFKDSFNLLMNKTYFEAYLTYRKKLLVECGYTLDDIERLLREEIKNKICSLDLPKTYSDSSQQEKLYSE